MKITGIWLRLSCVPWKSGYIWQTSPEFYGSFNDFLDLVKIVMCTLVSSDCVTFCKYIKRHVYPRNHGTHAKLNQIQKTYSWYSESCCWAESSCSYLAGTFKKKIMYVSHLEALKMIYFKDSFSFPHSCFTLWKFDDLIPLLYFILYLLLKDNKIHTFI